MQIADFDPASIPHHQLFGDAGTAMLARRVLRLRSTWSKKCAMSLHRPRVGR